jgi:hypothetical protein
MSVVGNVLCQRQLFDGNQIWQVPIIVGDRVVTSVLHRSHASFLCMVQCQKENELVEPLFPATLVLLWSWLCDCSTTLESLKFGMKHWPSRCAFVLTRTLLDAAQRINGRRTRGLARWRRSVVSGPKRTSNPFSHTPIGEVHLALVRQAELPWRSTLK